MTKDVTILLLLIAVILLIIQNMRLSKQEKKNPWKKKSKLSLFIDDAIHPNMFNYGTYNRWIILAIVLFIITGAVYYNAYYKVQNCDHVVSAYFLNGTAHEVKEMPTGLTVFRYNDLTYQYEYKDKIYLARIRAKAGTPEERIKIQINIDRPNQYLYEDNSGKYAILFIGSCIFLVICLIRLRNAKRNRSDHINRERWIQDHNTIL